MPLNRQSLLGLPLTSPIAEGLVIVVDSDDTELHDV